MLLAVFFAMLSWDGIVAVSWGLSVFVYVALVVIFEWLYFNWRPVQTWSLKKRHAINLMVLALVASLCAFAIKTQYDRQNDHDPMHMQATKADVAEVQQRLSELINSHIDSDNVSYKPLPGYSALINLRIRQLPQDNAKGYIFDIGDQKKGRFSVYTTKNTLTFAIIDLAGKRFTVTAPIGFNGFPYGVICSADFAFGADDTHSMMDIIVDGRIIASLSRSYRIDLGPVFVRHHGRPRGNIVLGADLQKKHGGIFDSFDLALFSRTLSLPTLRKLALLALQPEHIAHRYFLRFNGHQWASNDLFAHPNDSNLHLSSSAIHASD